MLIEKPIYFDIETDGFLEVLDTVHCLGYAVGDLPVELLVGKRQVSPLVSSWETDQVTVVAHNGIAFDIPALAKVFGLNASKIKVIDTLVLSRFIFPDLTPEDDKLVLKGKLPARLMGSHSLEAWGYRLGCHKGDYAGGWSVYTPEMGVYCKQDVEVLRKLYKHLLAQAPAQEAVELEHAVQTIIQRQVRRGVCFNVDKAIELNAVLSDKLIHLEKDLKATFGHWFQPSKDREGKVKTWTPARDNARLGYVAGAELTPVELVEFNPGSRAHITKVLLDAGWKPEKFTDAGNPKVDEEVLAGVDHPHVKKILAYLLVKKRLGQLADGENGWLRLTKRGRIHGQVNTNGAVTGRMTHASPNLAQVPKVKKKKIDGVEKTQYGEAGGWGYEMRDLFGAPVGYKLVGCDASGLELRMLAHYMGRFDKGAYGEIVVGGDIHSANQAAAELPTRDNAKTFIYGFLYGAGDSKIGSIVGKGADEGARLKAKFLSSLPALANLIKDLEARFEEQGWVRGLDGRRLYIGASLDKRKLPKRVWKRSMHKALNVLLQSAGAVVMKKALVLADTNLQAAGLRPGVDYEFVLNVHDEAQMEAIEAHAEFVGKTFRQAIIDAGVHFKMRCPLDGEYKIGNTWAETH